MFGLTSMLIVLLAAGMVRMLPEEQYQAILKSLDNLLSRFRGYVCQKETGSKLTNAAKAVEDIGETGVK
ncbi:hypothetical protein P879_07420 [Paragonimus westermani]|uniref:Uncharacterized protein n=1 Tax=Paragonimus westermani TaxID=34504 RepID=A0A8T0DBE2_9TREM|nr:hypothetical protein P879_07420 [Paragonimus westermani]